MLEAANKRHLFHVKPVSLKCHKSLIF